MGWHRGDGSLRPVPRPALAVPVALAAACLAAASVGACTPGAVRLAFRARPGTEYRYAVEVHAETTTSVQGQTPTHRVTDQHLVAEHRVVASDGSGVVVDVRLSGDGVQERTFRVRLDRAAALTEVERVDDLPAQVLGDLGLSEVFPVAAGAPPNRPLRPGTRWSLDQPVQLAGSAATRLRGTGRLKRLGMVDGRRAATVDTTYSLPIRQQMGDASMSGTATTAISATRAIADGAVVEVDAHTTGRFVLQLSPPAGVAGAPVPGTVSIEVRSTTRRTG